MNRTNEGRIHTSKLDLLRTGEGRTHRGAKDD